ncbi:unnamed protein product, partial [Lampetra fluviatilis]
RSAVEMELAVCKIDVMALNSQLLDAIQQKVDLSQELEAWQDDMHTVISQQLKEKHRRGTTAPLPTAARSPPGALQQLGVLSSLGLLLLLLLLKGYGTKRRIVVYVQDHDEGGVSIAAMLTLGRERPVMEPPAMEEEVVGGGLQAMADDDEDIDQYNDDTFGAGATDEDWEPSQDSPLLSLPTLYNPPPHHHHNNHNNHHHPHHPHHHHPCDDPWPHESSLLLLLPPCSSPGGVGVGVGCEGDEGDDGEGGEADERANDSLAESGFEDSISKLVLEDDMEDPAVIRAGVRRPLTEDSAIVDSLCSMSSWRGLMNRSLTPPPPLQPSIWGSPPAHVMSQLTHSLPPSHVDHSLFHAMECGGGGGGGGGGVGGGGGGGAPPLMVEELERSLVGGPPAPPLRQPQAFGTPPTYPPPPPPSLLQQQLLMQQLQHQHH